MRATKVWALACLVVLFGCGGNSSNSSLNSQFQPQVANVTDNFQFQSSGVTNVSETLNYTWQNTGIAANIDQATTVTAGTAVIIIKDSAGTQIYSAGLQNNGSFQSATGQTGNWTIQVVLQGYSGTINFRVQKRP